MLNGIIGKLNDFVDSITSGWLNLTEGKRKRPADNYSGFLWLVGATLLLVDIFIKNLTILIVGLVMIFYGIIRCFSPLGIHDAENRALEGLCGGLINGFKSLGSSFAKGAKDIKEADKTKHFRGVKNKMSEASERRKAKAERKRAEAELKREEEEAAWEARNMALAEYRARHASANQASNQSGNQSAEVKPKTEQSSVVKTSEPQVQVKVPEPQVEVKASEPQVEVKVSEPKVEIKTPEPQVVPKTEPVKEPVVQSTSSSTQTITRVMPKEEVKESPKAKEPVAEVKKEPVKPSVAEPADEPRLEQTIGDKKYYIFECPGCSQNVRIPNRGKKGKVAIVCPGCSTRFIKNRW